MPELNEKYVELRMVWNTWGNRQWYRMYMFGRTLPDMDDEALLDDIVDYFKKIDGYIDLWINVLTISSALVRFQLQVISPHRSHPQPYHTDPGILKGRWICGTQPWQATCRIKLHSLNWTTRSHWYQLSPVPRFDQLLSPSREEYLENVGNLTQFMCDGFTTVPGNIWRWAYKERNGAFHVINAMQAQLFRSTQITRRRVL